MKAYSYSEARQRLAEVLDRARREGAVEIRRRGGQVFILKPAVSMGSPLDVPAVSAGVSREEIVGLVRASRRSGERIFKQAASAKLRMETERKPRGRQKHGR
jgi:prevent-host-death family protein